MLYNFRYKSKFLEDLNIFKDASDETYKQITESEIDNKIKGEMSETNQVKFINII